MSMTTAVMLGLSPDQSSPHRHRERSEATQGGAPSPSVALLDCFAPLAGTGATVSASGL
ncbi:hypothetical protein [Methylobacterium sp. 13MFTsu3.1M2]|uniref:hypothetical protein n=1 Tax=Methylobacterium sp. 13MFTsu3.1M2 TaxID=1502776 RepID=UPI000B1B5C1E|nr:hypothetical protein [Methylobacterium sp. 13MFTsu3.1M2]